MASVIRRSSLSLACSLNHSNGKTSKPRKESIVLLTNLDTVPKGVPRSTISPMESKSWRKLPKFQRRFYEWLVYSHNLPIASEEGIRNAGNLRQQPAPIPALQPEVYSDYRRGGEADSLINAYDEEDEEIHDRQRSPLALHSFPEVVEKDVYSPYVSGMDVRLAQFVNQHNINMDDGAVIYPLPDQSTTKSKKKPFTPPCGCTRKQFIWTVSGTTVGIVALIALIATLAVIFGRVQPFRFPKAEPWWTHGLVYQIHVPTFANDVGGSLGRFKDVTSRIIYLADKVYATAAILTGVLDSDKNGVRNWMSINQDINSEGDSVDTLLGGLATRSKEREIELILGMPLYATSERHAWFQQSALQNPAKYMAYYMWRTEAPVNQIEARYYSYNSERRAYYRHAHGNPASPLLNLTDIEVQTELKAVIAFWKEKLGISGVLIINSTNILEEMAAPLTTILSSGRDENTDTFTWFADNPTADKLLTGKPLCYYELISNERITTRTGDINAQINTILPEIKQRSCSPIWRLEQKSMDYTDYFSLQKFAAFLPGLSLMKAGEEVQLMTGATELIQWGYTDATDFKTYWPINVLPGETAQGRLAEWERFGAKTVGSTGTIFNTDWSTNEVKVVTVPRTENLFVVQRVYSPSTAYIATFFVSFQSLNAYTNLADVVPNPDGSTYAELIYEGRRLLLGSQLELTWLCNSLACELGESATKVSEYSQAYLVFVSANMRPSDCYSSLAGPSTPYGNPSSGNPNFSSPGSNQIPSQLPYNSALFFNTMVAAAANSFALPNMIGQSSPNVAAYNAAYQNAAYNQYYYQQQYGNSNLQRQNSAFQPAINYGVPQYQANAVKITKEATPTPSRKTKKRPPSEPPEKLDLRRREDFNELARARTDVLLKDKSLFTPLTVNDTMANGSSTSSCNSMNSDQMSASKALALKNRELLNVLLDERVRQFLMFPSIMELLRTKQAAINKKMREEETFVAKMRKTGTLPVSVDPATG
nr:trehalose 6 phosphate hydrolase [Hymenolepis microstoma]